MAKVGTLVAGTTATAADVNSGFAAWTAWSPTYTNLTIGNGTVTARYTQAGRITYVYWGLVWGSTTSIAGSVKVSNFPVTMFSSRMVYGQTAEFFDASAGTTVGGVLGFDTTTSVSLYVDGTAGTYRTAAVLSSTVPFTWTTSDEMTFMATYEGTS